MARLAFAAILLTCPGLFATLLAMIIARKLKGQGFALELKFFRWSLLLLFFQALPFLAYGGENRFFAAFLIWPPVALASAVMAFVYVAQRRIAEQEE
jgi:hypothetical protein